MRDLVGEDAGEHVVAVGAFVEAARDEHVAAGRGEGVDGGGGEHGETPFQLRPVGILRERAADEVHAVHDLGVAHDAAELGDDFERDGIADVALLLGADAGDALGDL